MVARDAFILQVVLLSGIFILHVNANKLGNEQQPHPSWFIKQRLDVIGLWEQQTTNAVPLANHNNQPSNVTVNQKIVTLTFQGGAANCSACPEGTPQPSYACSNGFDGVWNNGALQFLNPIPPHNYITAIYVTLIGRFNCQILQPSAIVISTLQGETLWQSSDLPPDPYGCGGCTNCMISYAYPPRVVDSWPGYSYTPQAINDVEIFVVQNSICLSSVILALNYSIS